MGYEVKILIGLPGMVSKKIERSTVGEIDGDSVYYPYVKDGNGVLVKTDVDETYFMIAAEIDLCKVGDSNLFKALEVNKDKKREYYWYGMDGNVRISDDRYGDKPELASLEDCIEALKKDVAESDYRRFKWALALLESMKGSEMKVLWFGH